MGIDISQIISNAKDAVNQGMNDILKIGGNAGLGYLEQQGIDILSADKANLDKATQSAAATVLSRPGDSNGFGAYLQNVLQAPVLKQYGPALLIGVAVVGFAAIFIYKR